MTSQHLHEMRGFNVYHVSFEKLLNEPGNLRSLGANRDRLQAREITDMPRRQFTDEDQSMFLSIVAKHIDMFYSC